jgi:maltose-binding protein MalE
MDVKKLWSGGIVLVVFCAGLLLVRCAPPPKPTPTPAPTATPLPTPTLTATPTPTITPTPTPTLPALTLWHDLPSEQAAQLEQEARQFEASQKAVRVVLQKYQDEPALERSVAQDGSPGDVVLGNARAVGFLRNKQLIQPADALFERDFLSGLARPGLEGVSQGGQVWGIPHTLGMHLMLFYNPKRVSNPPADTNSLIELAASLAKPGQFGLGMNSMDPLWLLPWLSAYGGWPVDDEGRPTLNTEPMVQALTFVRGLASEHKVITATADYDTGLQAFKSGQTALWIDGEWILSELREAPDTSGDVSQGMQWGVARLPILSDTRLDPACLVAGKYFVIGAQVSGVKRDAARLLIARLVGPEAGTRWMQSFHTLPAALAVLNGPEVQNDPFLRISAAQMLAGRGVGLSAGLQPALEAMRGPLEDVLSNRIAPKEAARGMQARAEASK